MCLVTEAVNMVLPTDPNYDAVADGVPVAIISGTLGVGDNVAALIAAINSLKTSVDLLTTAVNNQA